MEVSLSSNSAASGYRDADTLRSFRPTPKDQMKRNLKDIATSARFSLYRTKKKLLRKADL